MTEEIGQLKEICSEMLDEIYKSNQTYIANYMLSIFRDPGSVNHKNIKVF